MTKTINIERQAFGSRTDTTGDTTLLYSANPSNHVRNVNGKFLDNPPKLSLNHASLVWRYNADVDKYLLIHVQGSHVIHKEKGRQYTFRAGYEVSREDMNAIGFQLTPLFHSMPRMTNMQLGEVDATTKVDTNTTSHVRPSEALASHLIKAVIDGQQLYISMDNPGESLKNDGVFEAIELKTLLATIDSIPIDKRRYATFGFCVDDHFASVLDNIPIIIYLKDSSITISQEARNISWEEATTTMVKPSIVGIEKEWKGASEPLLTEEQLSVMRKTVNGPQSLIGEEWQIWLSIGHQLSELQVNSWPEFTTLFEQMDEKTRIAFIADIKNISLSWSIDEMTEDLYKMMDYNNEQLFELQKQKLREYLFNNADFKFGFLFSKGITGDYKACLIEEEFLNHLNIGNKDDVLKWYNIYKQHEVLKKKPKTAFIDLFCQYAEGTLDEVMDIFNLLKEQKCHFLQEEYLKSINKDKLSDLLSHEPSNLIKNSEQLLAIAELLSKEWKSYITKTLQPAIMSALTTSDKQFIGPLSERRLDELFDSESYYWELANSYPYVSNMVEEELADLRQKRFEETIKGNNRKKQGEQFNERSSKGKFKYYLWALIGWLLGLLMGAGAMFALNTL